MRNYEILLIWVDHFFMIQPVVWAAMPLKFIAKIYLNTRKLTRVDHPTKNAFRIEIFIKFVGILQLSYKNPN